MLVSKNYVLGHSQSQALATGRKINNHMTLHTLTQRAQGYALGLSLAMTSVDYNYCLAAELVEASND